MAITGRDYERRLQRIPAYLPRPARLAFTDHSPAVLYTNFRACVREYSAHGCPGVVDRSRSDAAHRSLHRDHFQGQDVSLENGNAGFSGCVGTAGKWGEGESGDPDWLD